MNRRNFLTLGAAAVATLAIPISAAMSQEDALRKARSKWGRYALVSLKTGAVARAANRPNGEYCIGWKGCKVGPHLSSYWYGDSWEDAFDTMENKCSYNHDHHPGPNS